MNFLNKWSIIFLGIVLVFTIIFLNQYKIIKNQPEWRYEIHGWVWTKKGQHKATWYTDTLEFGENYLKYENSDGTEVIIPAPYVIIDYKYDTIIKDTIPSF